jgi:hypothetical protein
MTTILPRSRQQTIEATPGIENKQDNNPVLANQPDPYAIEKLRSSDSRRSTKTTPSNLRKLPNAYQTKSSKLRGVPYLVYKQDRTFLAFVDTAFLESF